MGSCDRPVTYVSKGLKSLHRAADWGVDSQGHKKWYIPIKRGVIRCKVNTGNIYENTFEANLRNLTFQVDFGSPCGQRREHQSALLKTSHFSAEGSDSVLVLVLVRPAQKTGLDLQQHGVGVGSQQGTKTKLRRWKAGSSPAGGPLGVSRNLWWTWPGGTNDKH